MSDKAIGKVNRDGVIFISQWEKKGGEQAKLRPDYRSFNFFQLFEEFAIFMEELKTSPLSNELLLKSCSFFNEFHRRLETEKVECVGPEKSH